MAIEGVALLPFQSSLRLQMDQLEQIRKRSYHRGSENHKKRLRKMILFYYLRSLLIVLSIFFIACAALLPRPYSTLGGMTGLLGVPSKSEVYTGGYQRHDDNE